MEFLEDEVKLLRPGVQASQVGRTKVRETRCALQRHG